MELGLISLISYDGTFLFQLFLCVNFFFLKEKVGKKSLEEKVWLAGIVGEKNNGTRNTQYVIS